MTYKKLTWISVTLAVLSLIIMQVLLNGYAPNWYNPISLFESINPASRVAAIAASVVGMVAVILALVLCSKSKLIPAAVVVLQSCFLLVGIVSEGYGVIISYATISNISFDVSALAFASLALITAAHALSFGLTWLALWIASRRDSTATHELGRAG